MTGRFNEFSYLDDRLRRVFTGNNSGVRYGMYERASGLYNDVCDEVTSQGGKRGQAACLLSYIGRNQMIKLVPRPHVTFTEEVFYNMDTAAARALVALYSHQEAQVESRIGHTITLR